MCLMPPRIRTISRWLIQKNGSKSTVAKSIKRMLVLKWWLVKQILPSVANMVLWAVQRQWKKMICSSSWVPTRISSSLILRRRCSSRLRSMPRKSCPKGQRLHRKLLQSITQASWQTAAFWVVGTWSSTDRTPPSPWVPNTKSAQLRSKSCIRTQVKLRRVSLRRLWDWLVAALWRQDPFLMSVQTWATCSAWLQIQRESKLRRTPRLATRKLT